MVAKVGFETADNELPKDTYIPHPHSLSPPVSGRSSAYRLECAETCTTNKIKHWLEFGTTVLIFFAMLSSKTNKKECLFENDKVCQIVFDGKGMLTQYSKQTEDAHQGREKTEPLLLLEDIPPADRPHSKSRREPKNRPTNPDEDLLILVRRHVSEFHDVCFSCAFFS